MKRMFLVLLLLSVPCCHAIENTHVYFSPHGGCTDAIVTELSRAQKTVLVQAYAFTSSPIAEALVKAKRRGVKVEVILDKEQARDQYTEATFLANSGIRTLIDAEHTVAHNKVIVIDDETVITGSFNFTKSAEEHNAENLLVIKDKSLAEKYTRNWRQHEAHSHPYDKATLGASTSGNHGHFHTTH